MSFGCRARRQGDEMYCPRCRLTWDVSEATPPECVERPKQDREVPESIMKRIYNNLGGCDE